MDMVIEYQLPLISRLDGLKIGGTQVVVKTNDYAILQYFTADRRGYNNACRFMRLIERGYSPAAACSRVIYDFAATRQDFDFLYEPSAHDKLTDERVDLYVVDTPDIMMFTGPLTPTDENRLYALWLKDGDEIFMFEDVLMECSNVPALLYNFRTRAQREDENSGDWSHSHHSDNVSY